MRERTSIQRTAHDQPAVEAAAVSCICIPRIPGLLRMAAGLRCVGVVAATALLAACGGDDGGGGSGTLVLPFELGNDRSCESVGVESVRAELKGTSYEMEADCNTGQVRFKSVPVGTYRVIMVAMDSNGVEVMDNVATGETSVTVTGNGTDALPTPITLTAAPAHLKVRWDFMFSSCMGAGIETFDVKAWRGTGDSLIVQQTLTCKSEGEGRGLYHSIDDPERRFGGDVGGEVSVQALDKDKVPVGKAAVFKFKAPGAGHDVKVTLECTEGSCTGSGKPDSDS